MLRPSLQVFLALIGLVLLMTLGYALLNRQGPEQALQRAREELRAGNAAKAIQLLTKAQRSLGQSEDPAIQRVLQLRFRAHESCGNYELALRDVNELQEKHGVDDLQLRRARMSLLVAGERVEEALSSGETYLADAPHDARLLELMGLALRLSYQRMLDTFENEQLPALLGGEPEAKARELLRVAAFRAPGDAVRARHEEQLLALLGESVRARSALGDLRREITLLQETIDDSRDYLGRAVRSAESRPLALEAYVSQLLAAGEAERAALAAWLFLQRGPDSQPSSPEPFDRSESETLTAVHAAIDAFETLDLPELVLQSQPRWFGTEGLEAHLEARKTKDLAPTLDACVAWARALVRSGRAKELRQLEQTLSRWQHENNRWLGPQLLYVQAMRQYLDGDNAGTEHRLREYHKARSATAKPQQGADIWAETMQLRIEIAKEAGETQRHEELYAAWVEARPENSDLRMQRARFYLDTKRPLLAGAEAEAILEIPGASRDRALDILLRSIDERQKATGRDSVTLCEQLLQRGTTIPEAPAHPVQYLGIAAYAHLLAAAGNPGALPVAERNAKLALEIYPWSSSARFFLASCRFLRGDPEQAAHQAAAILEDVPDHELALELQLRALRARKATPERLQRAALQLMQRHPQREQSALAFGEALLRRGAYAEALLLTESAVGRQAAPGGAMDWIRLRAQHGLGEYEGCVATAQRFQVGSESLLEALEIGIEAAARCGDRDALARMLLALETAPGDDGTALYRSASLLTSLAYTTEAMRLVRAIHEGGERTRPGRSGRLYELWGRLLLADGRDEEARSRLESALSFEDGDGAWSLLIAERILAGATEEAEELRSQVATLSGSPALATWIDVRLGNAGAALASVRSVPMPVEILRPALGRTIRALAKDASALTAGTNLAFPGLAALCDAAPAAMLDALLLPDELAFAKVGMAGVEKIAEIEVAFEVGYESAGWRRLVRGNALELRGRKEEALGTYVQTTHDYLYFQLTYPELFRLGRELDPEILASPHLVPRYLEIIKLGFDVLTPEIRVVYLLYYARHAALMGRVEEAEFFLNVARLSSIGDPQPLRALMRRRMTQGDVPGILEHASLLLELETGTERRETLRIGFKAAFDGLRDQGLGAPGSERQQRIGEWIERAEEHLRTEPVPLAHALALRLQALPVVPLRDRLDEKIQEPARFLCNRWAESFRQSQRREVDEEALAHVFRAWLENDDAPYVRSRLELVLARDPSLLALWMLRAELDEADGLPERALEQIAWLRELTPVPKLLAEIGRLQSMHRIGSAFERRRLLAALPAEEAPEFEIARGLLTYSLGSFEAARERLSGVTGRYAQLARYYADLATLFLADTSEYRRIADELRALPGHQDPHSPFRAARDYEAQLRVLVAEPDRAQPSR